MNKEEIRKAVLFALRTQLNVLEKAASTAAEAATHDEAKSEGKYDTRAVESSYLAQAQSQRVHELSQKITELEHQSLPEFTNSDPVAPFALITLSRRDTEETKTFLLLKKIGGVDVQLGDNKISVITPASPIGTQLNDAYVGDEILVGSIEFEIVKLQ